MKSKAQLVEKYLKLLLKEKKAIKTSADANDYFRDKNYKKRLKEFLYPILENAVQYDKNKMGKNTKTYAQAIGIEQV